MSIDLSKAKVGDKFRLITNKIVTYICNVEYDGELWHRVMFEDGRVLDIDDMWIEENLVEQVFDYEKDRAITDKILKDVEKVVNGVAEAMPHIESTTIANLPREPLPENNEDDAELQRRQEVVELAEKLVTNELFAVTNHLHDMRELGAAINLDSPTEYAFLIAEEFVNNKSKYLKNGKLC
jgi:hypothetical protein